MKLSDYVIQFVESLGVRHVFMLPGGGAMHLNDSLGSSKVLATVCNLHEQGSVVAAEAYGQYSGLGVMMVTTGPGGTNAVTGIAGAWLESTPLLVISGQVKRQDLVGDRGVRQIGFQEIEITSIVRPITKFAEIVLDPENIRMLLEKSVFLATNGRKGPVWIDIPLDVQASDVDPAKLAGFVPAAEMHASRSGAPEAAQETIRILAESRRPIVLVGNGVRHANAVKLFLEWAERVRIPILTTWKAMDMIEDTHPLFAGRPGAVGQRAANFAQQKCDAIICLGARLDFGQTAYNHSNFAPLAKRVVVDIDPNEIKKLQMELSVAFEGDAGEFLSEISRATKAGTLPDWSDWLAKIQSWRERFPIILSSFRTVPSGVHNYLFVDVLGRLLADGDLLVPGSSGACSEVTCQALPVSSGIRFINTQGLGAMGFGIPAALGACLASGRRRTVCIDGDGGFPMNAQELSVISHMELPIKFFVLNNKGYGSIRATQINYFNKRFLACDVESGLYLPKLEMLAASAGIQYRRITRQDDLQCDISAILELPGPVLCEVEMAPDQLTQPKVSSRQTDEGKMITMPMEDLWPFLERKEFHEIMAE